MNRASDLAGEILRLAPSYPTSWLGGLGDRERFEDLTAFCMFVGYPRSGHSTVGALLDAHPDVVISHELDVLKHVRLRFGRHQLFHLILQRSAEFADPQRARGGYVSSLPPTWLGTYRNLKVIGDKKGGATSLRLRRSPTLLRRLRKTVRLPVKLIHVVRNPYDNISTLKRRMGQRSWRGWHLTLKQAIDYYFLHCEVVAETLSRTPAEDFLELRHESLIADPVSSLGRICQWLGVDGSPDYLRACARSVYRQPHQSRSEENWTRELIERTRARMARFPFLTGYTFDN